MLYERWKQISARNRDAVALRDLASGKNWTFGQLAEASENNEAQDSRVAFPRGHSPEFILQLLAAWRKNKPVCPLEHEQRLPQVSDVPGKFAHLKITSATAGTPRMVAFTAEQ